MDDITACLNGRDKELVELAEKVLKKSEERGTGEELRGCRYSLIKGKSKERAK